MSAKPRICVVHIPKTGGTWLRNSLIQLYGWQNVCPLTFEHEYPADPSELDKFAIVSGHFGFRYATSLGRPMITVLREPCERTLSLYYYWRSVPQQDHGPGLAKRYSFEGFIDAAADYPDLTVNIRNTQTYQIARGHTNNHRNDLVFIQDEEILSNAMENLKRFAVVGITEDIPDLVQRIKSGLGIVLDPERAPANGSGRKTTAADLPRHVLRKMRRLVNLDLVLYRVVRRQLGRRKLVAL